MGIAWETGYLVGLADSGIDMRLADLVVGTSAGSQVGAVIAAGIPWDDIWERLVDPKTKDEKPPGSFGGSLFAKYDEIAASSKTPEEWIQKTGKLAIESKTMTENEHLSRIRTKIGDLLRLGNLLLSCELKSKRNEKRK